MHCLEIDCDRCTDYYRCKQSQVRPSGTYYHDDWAFSGYKRENENYQRLEKD